jgi:tetratricopeptide (TPR) repeat protein
VLTGAATSDSRAPPPGPAAGDPGYAWQHGLYWLASNLAADSPLVLVVDDLQWCDAPSARALAFIARRLEGQPLALILATRPLDPALTPEAATLVGDPTAELLRPSPLTQAAIAALVAARLSDEPDDRFVRACLEVTGGNPFLVGELLDEAAARGIPPTAAAADDVGAMVPRGVANAVLLRLARLAPAAAGLARALSALGDGAQVGDAARLAGLGGVEVETAMGALVSAGVVEPSGTVRFTHPILRAAIYAELSPAERERLHHAAATILRERGAPAGQVAVQVMYTEPTADPGAVALLRHAARDALALGDAAGAAALLSRALDEPPVDGDRPAVLLELGQAHARAGAPEAIAPLSEIVERGEEAAAIAAAAIELSGVLFFAGRAAEGAAILRRAQERLPAGEPAREQLEVALLGVSSTSASARHEADATIAALRDPGGPARDVLQATTLATLAMEEVLCLRSASTAIDLAERALAAELPLEPHRGENWALLALVALAAADGLDAALRGTDEILTRARKRGAALTVVTISGLRAHFGLRRGDLAAAEADAQAAIELAPTYWAPSSSSWRWRRRCSRASSATRPPRPCAGSSTAPAFATTPTLRRAPSCATPRACSAPRPATTKPRSRSCAAATTRRSAARTRPCSRGGRRRPSRWPSSAAATRLAPWPPTSCAARGRSARRGRSASRCAPTRSLAPPRNGRSGWRRRSQCCNPRRRGLSMPGCWSTSAPRSVPQASAARRGSLYSRRSSWPPAAAPEPWSAARGPSSRRSASGPEGPSTPGRTR